MHMEPLTTSSSSSSQQPPSQPVSLDLSLSLDSSPRQRGARLFSCLFCNRKFLKSRLSAATRTRTRRREGHGRALPGNPSQLARDPAYWPPTFPIGAHPSRSHPHTTPPPSQDNFLMDFGSDGLPAQFHTTHFCVTGDAVTGGELMDPLNWQRADLQHPQASTNGLVAAGWFGAPAHSMGEDSDELDLALRM